MLGPAPPFSDGPLSRRRRAGVGNPVVCDAGLLPNSFKENDKNGFGHSTWIEAGEEPLWRR